MVVLNFRFFFRYRPKTSCVPPPIFVMIKLGFILLIEFKSFLSDRMLGLYFGAKKLYIFFTPRFLKYFLFEIEKFKFGSIQ